MAEFLLPTKIRRELPEGIRIEWNDGHRSFFGCRFLRLHCQCAVCVDEWTGRPLLDPVAVPADIQPQKIEYVGNYALRIVWSDGHGTGIFAWKFLRQICPCTDCRNPTPGTSRWQSEHR